MTTEAPTYIERTLSRITAVRDRLYSRWLTLDQETRLDGDCMRDMAQSLDLAVSELIEFWEENASVWPDMHAEGEPRLLPVKECEHGVSRMLCEVCPTREENVRALILAASKVADHTHIGAGAAYIGYVDNLRKRLAAVKEDFPW
jgi:hypothetical protein